MAVSLHSQTGLSLEKADMEVELSIAQLCDWAARCDKEKGGVPVRIYVFCPNSSNVCIILVAVCVQHLLTHPQRSGWHTGHQQSLSTSGGQTVFKVSLL